MNAAFLDARRFPSVRLERRERRHVHCMRRAGAESPLSNELVMSSRVGRRSDCQARCDWWHGWVRRGATGGLSTRAEVQLVALNVFTLLDKPQWHQPARCASARCGRHCFLL